MWQGLQSMECSKLSAEGGYDILILKVEQGLLKNWPQVGKNFKCAAGPIHGMGCSKLLAEGGIGHTNFELPGFLIGVQIQSYGKVQ